MEVIKMYSGVWESKSDVAQSFYVELPAHIEIVFAHYSGHSSPDEDDYEMWARVLFADTSQNPVQLYEVYGSHCSCYGLEEQWQPSPVTIQDIVHDMRMGNAWGTEQTVKDRMKTALSNRFPEIKF
jgi:hypothetical protein